MWNWDELRDDDAFQPISVKINRTQFESTALAQIQFTADAAGVGIHGARIQFDGAAPNVFQYVAAGQKLAKVTKQEEGEIEFLDSQIDWYSVATNRAPFDIDDIGIEFKFFFR